jgi:hypothetical protein
MISGSNNMEISQKRNGIWPTSVPNMWLSQRTFSKEGTGPITKTLGPADDIVHSFGA